MLIVPKNNLDAHGLRPPRECRRAFAFPSVTHLRVGLVVLAVVSGGIRAVRGCGCRCRAVGEGGGALGDDGRDGGTVHPGARLPALGFTGHGA